MAIQPALTEYDKGYDFSLNETGDKLLVSGSEEVGLRLKQRLQFYTGEWAFDTKAGIDWLKHVFVKPANINLINSLLKRHILQTPGVTGLVDFKSTFNPGQRAITVDFRYTDQYNDDIQTASVSI